MKSCPFCDDNMQTLNMEQIADNNKIYYQIVSNANVAADSKRSSTSRAFKIKKQYCPTCGFVADFIPRNRIPRRIT